MDSTQRFSNRVQDYRKHRPAYPAEIIDILKQEKALPKHAVVADIGSGTGLLAQRFFEFTQKVYGVEPNENMRKQAEEDFAATSNFFSISGTAESTNLPTGSIDLITAGQAFHWFDRKKAAAEFKRILKPDGYAALIWNYRDVEADDLQRMYENILEKHIPDYKQLDHKTMTNEIIRSFFNSDVKKFMLPNFQLFDLESLLGRVLSSSYVPKPPDPIAEKVLSQVEELFNTCKHNSRIQFIYKTVVYLGQFKQAWPK